LEGMDTVSSGADPEALIELVGLKKIFTVDGKPFTALDGIDLAIRKGEIYGIIGMSGAGKSTLIRCINRLEEPNEGAVFIRGRDITGLKNRDLYVLRRSLGMIFQQFNLFMQRTALKNVMFPLETAGIPHKDAKARAAELLEMVGLSDKLTAYPAQLSGGQKQRVAIARALALNPDVLLCDEATSALDPMTTRSILSLLEKINHSLGVTIVIITHEMEVIRQICTHVAIIDNGRIAEKGTVKEIFLKPASPAGKKLFRDSPAEAAVSGRSCIRIIFEGESALKPVIAGMVLTCGAPVNILSGNIKRFSGNAFGQLVVELPEDRNAAHKALGYLRQNGLVFEEVIQNGNGSDPDIV
jgi:D-methionine transport system ATP-binding protein